jgi:hypothetical protein
MVDAERDLAYSLWYLRHSKSLRTAIVKPQIETPATLDGDTIGVDSLFKEWALRVFEGHQ